MQAQRTYTMSGRVGLADVENIVGQLRIDETEQISVELENLEDIDITGIQLIVALKEQFGDKLDLKIGAIDPNLKSLLDSSGIYDLLNDFSNS